MTRRKDIVATGVLEERVDSDGRRQLSLTQKEQKTLRRQRLAEQAAALFLDIDTRRSWPEKARALGISINALKDLVKTREFDEAYNLLFPEVGHDPSFRAAKSALGDLVPTAVKRLQEILDDETVSKTTMLKAISEVLDRNQVDNRGQQSDRLELMEFLKDMGGIKIENLNIIPPDYAREMQRLSTGEVIDSVVVDET